MWSWSKETSREGAYTVSVNFKHIGLRAQIVLSLAALLAVVFSFTAMAMLWVLRTSLESQRRELGTAAAQVLVEGLAERIRHERSDVEVGRLFDATVGQAGVIALGFYDVRGEPLVRRGVDTDGPILGGIDPRRPRPFQTARSAPGGGEELLIIRPIGRTRGFLVAVARLGVTDAELSRLARPVLIYLLASGLLLLGFGYVTLTSLIVRPLEALTRATDQVTQGKLDVSVPVRGGREIATAATAFNTMTHRVREQRTRLEAQLKELERTTGELRETQDHLVRSAKLASVGSLAAGVAHEVGNPVSAIIGLSEVLLEGDLEREETQDYIGRIGREAERVNRIIRDLLEYARSTPDEQNGPASVVDAADAAVGLMAPQKTFRLIDIQIVVDEDLPLVDLGMDQLTQVVLNLLMNAADAVDGEGDVRLRARRVEGAALPDAPSGGIDAVCVDVSDTGPGLSDEVLTHIFEPFFTTKEPGEGTGLGLAMCEGIVTQAGGLVSARNNSERGLTVSLTLPVFHDE